MKKSRTEATIVVVFLALLGSNCWAAELPAMVSERVAQARASVKQVDMATFRKLLDKKSDALIIDVREPDEYQRGHMPGAINIPRGKLEFSIWPHVGYPDKLNLKRTLYIYCATAARSALATETLSQLGFTNATLINMQLEDWRQAGYPLEEEL